MSRALRLVLTFAAALCAVLWGGAAEAQEATLVVPVLSVASMASVASVAMSAANAVAPTDGDEAGYAAMPSPTSDLPAMARRFEAPRCDGRGATTFAAAPTMQPLLRSLQILPETDGCQIDDGSAICSDGQHRTPAPEHTYADPILPTPAALVVAPSRLSGTLAVPPVSLDAAPSHVGTLDRPPR